MYVLCVLWFTLHHQGAIPQRGWAVSHSEAQVSRQIYYAGGNQSAWKHVYIFDDAPLLIRWFEGFNWDGLYRRTLNPPLIPRVRNI